MAALAPAAAQETEVAADACTLGEDGAHGEAEEGDSLVAPLGRVAKRKLDDEAMRLRVDADTAGRAGDGG